MGILGTSDFKVYLGDKELGKMESIEVSTVEEERDRPHISNWREGSLSGTLEMTGSIKALYPEATVPYPRKRPKSKRLQKKQFKNWVRANGVPL